MGNRIKKRFSKIALSLAELMILLSPSKIMAQIQVKYGMQPLYGVPVQPEYGIMPPLQNNILGVFQLAFLPFIILFVIFIGIIMFIKRLIKK